MAENAPTAAFRCTKPELMDDWKTAVDNGYAKFNQRLKEYGENIGRHNFSIRRGWWKIWVMGYKDDDPKSSPLPGWRRDRDSGICVPYLRTNIGKAVGARLEALEFSIPPVPGVPEIILGEGYMGTMNVEKYGEHWYGWTTVPLRGDDEGLLNPSDMNSLKEVDRDLWAPIKMSEFWTAKESHHG